MVRHETRAGRLDRLGRRRDLRRICNEFLEMPGLRVTFKQAQRLWGLDEQTCLQVLNALVEAQFLCIGGSDRYGRATDGPVALPRLRMAKVQISELHAPGVKDVV